MSKKIIIIGGGPAGYEAALTGATLGGDITLIEHHKIGGTCLNYGCIPTKTLIEHAGLFNKIKESTTMGINVSDPSFDYALILERQHKIVNDLCQGIAGKLSKAKVKVIKGFAMVESSKSVKVIDDNGNSQIIDGDCIILATGSKTYKPPFEGIDLPGILSSKGLLALTTLPRSITIVGGGVIGMEFASLLNHFGVETQVLEYEQNILPTVDSAISKRLKNVCTSNGISITTKAKVNGFKLIDHQIETSFKVNNDVQTCTSDVVLLAIGRVGVFNPDNCDTLGIKHTQRFITVDHQYETSLKDVYAIGDVNGLSLLAHSAYDQGRQIMSLLLEDKDIVEKNIPSCIFTSPEIGSIGLTEENVKEKKIIFQSQKTLYGQSGKAMAMGTTTGFIKSIIDDQGYILGLHILGAHATDLIHYGSIAIEGKMTIHQLKDIVFAHPTLGELFSDHVHSYKKLL